MISNLDDDALFAAVELVGRSGARELEFGYLHDNVPTDQAAWWATARYQGVKLTAENKPGPVEALEALAQRLLTGGKCLRCGSLIALSDDGAFAHSEGRLIDGTPWDFEDARKTGQCRWSRVGRRWEPGCQHEKTPGPLPTYHPNAR